MKRLSDNEKRRKKFLQEFTEDLERQNHKYDDQIPINLRELQRDERLKVQELRQSWADKEQILSKTQQSQSEKIRYAHELKMLKKMAQEERLEQQMQWNLRFSEGIAN